MEQVQKRAEGTAAILARLGLAWGGTVLLISPSLSILRDPAHPMLLLAGTAAYWGLAALVIAIGR